VAPARVVEVSLQAQNPVGDATAAAVEGAVIAAAAMEGASVARTVGEAGPPFVLTVALTLPSPPAGRALRALQGAAASADADTDAAALADRLLNDGSLAYALAAAGVPGDLGYDSLEALMVVRVGWRPRRPLQPAQLLSSPTPPHTPTLPKTTHSRWPSA
jgi:hypothetical protein